MKYSRMAGFFGIVLFGLIGLYFFTSGSFSLQPVQTDPQPLENPQNLLIVQENYGGLCEYGACRFTTKIYKDGQVEVESGSGYDESRKLDLESSQRLTKLVNDYDFSEVVKSRFTGTCPVAFDGQATKLTIYQEYELVRIDSCEQNFNLIQASFIDRYNELAAPRS